jgi:hypothetical protein
MNNISSRNSIPKARRLVPKNYVTIEYILKPSPLSYRNYISGKNLITKTESCKGLEKNGVKRNHSSRPSADFNFYKLDFKEINNQKYFESIVGNKILVNKRTEPRKHKSIDKKHLSNYPSAIRNTSNNKACKEEDKIMVQNRGFVGSKICKLNSSKILLNKLLYAHKSFDVSRIVA